MSSSVRDEFVKQLRARGFSDQLESADRTIVLADSYSTAAELADLLEVMVSRREKIFRSVAVVGEEVARRNYENTVLIIDAIKAVIGQCQLRAER
jgi:hypothetical protein